MKFDINNLSNNLKQIDYIEFVLILGSSKNGMVKQNSDIDLGIYFKEDKQIGFDEMAKIFECTEKAVPGIKFDICRLNTAGEILKMEALKGNLLFSKNQEIYAKFYSITCREYEDYIYWMSRQLKYRKLVK